MTVVLQHQYDDLRVEPVEERGEQITAGRGDVHRQRPPGGREGEVPGRRGTESLQDSQRRRNRAMDQVVKPDPKSKIGIAVNRVGNRRHARHRGIPQQHRVKAATHG